MQAIDSYQQSSAVRELNWRRPFEVSRWCRKVPPGPSRAEDQGGSAKSPEQRPEDLRLDSAIAHVLSGQYPPADLSQLAGVVPPEFWSCRRSRFFVPAI